MSDIEQQQAPSGADPMDEIAALLMGDDGEAESTDEAIDNPPEVDDADDAGDDIESDEVEDAGGEGDLEVLAAELGLKPHQKLIANEDGTLSVQLKVNGKIEEVALGEALDAQQYGRANDEKSRELAEQRKAFEAQQKEVEQQLLLRAQQTQALTAQLQQQLLKEYQAIDWDRLRQVDPAEWVAKQREFEVRANEVQQFVHSASQMNQQAMQEQDARHKAERQQYLIQQRDVLIAERPEWKDPEVMRSSLTAIREGAMKHFNVPEERLENVTDAFEVKILEAAIAHMEGKSVAEKKVANVPKMQRASNGRFIGKSGHSAKLDKLINRAKSAKGSNKRDLQADATAALLLGG